MQFDCVDFIAPHIDSAVMIVFNLPLRAMILTPLLKFVFTSIALEER